MLEFKEFKKIKKRRWHVYREGVNPSVALTPAALPCVLLKLFNASFISYTFSLDI